MVLYYQYQSEYAMERDGKISLANILFLYFSASWVWSFPIPSCSTPQTRGFGWSSKFPSTPISIYRYYIHYISIIYLLYIYIYLLYIYYISIIYLLYIYIYIYYIYIIYHYIYIYISIIYTLYIYLYIHYISIIYTLYIHYIYNIYIIYAFIYIYVYYQSILTPLADFGTSPRLGRAGITQALVACPLESCIDGWITTMF